MSIDFNPSRWDYIRKTYGAWWERKLERPVVPVVLNGKDPGRSKPAAPLLSQATCADLSIPAGDLIDRIDYELSKQVYLGDAFPYYNMDAFGPGVVAAFLGARLDNSTGGVWFHPEKILPVEELHFEYNAENKWLKRVKEIYTAGRTKWNGQVIMGMVDLGGVLDILATFRSTENLLMDLYDSPDEVKRLVKELSLLWHRFYSEINDILHNSNGYSDWSHIYSEVPNYVLQSDFSYMISPSMFDEFTRPELEFSCNSIPNTIYHLDGVGQLPHLKSLLEIESLNAVQWIPGDGKPDQSHWPEVYKQIHDAGKGIQVADWGKPDSLDAVISQLGTSKGVLGCPITADISQMDEWKKKLYTYGIE